jgi:hypothetical protein
VAVVDRDVAPPDGALPLGLDRVLDQLLQEDPPLGVGGQVAHAHAIAPGRRKLDTGRRSTEECVRDLEEDPGAVAGSGIGTLGPTVLEVLQRLKRLVDHRMAGLAP